jgi:hypothetical protein
MICYPRVVRTWYFATVVAVGMGCQPSTLPPVSGGNYNSGSGSGGPKLMGSGPDASLRVTCSNQDDCFSEAEQACPAGYIVVSHAVRSQDSEGMFGVATHGGATEEGYLVFECKGGGNIKPSWEREREQQEHDKAELADEPRQSPPTSLAGFKLDGPLRVAQTLCVEAEHRWSDAGHGAGQCSGMVTDLELEAGVRVTACGTDDTVCALEVSGRPSADAESYEAWLNALAELKRELSDKYGKPTSLKRKWPEPCRGQGLLDCLSKGDTLVRYRWTWKDGHRISLWLGRDDDQAALRLRYETPEYRERSRTTAKPGDRL